MPEAYAIKTIKGARQKNSGGSYSQFLPFGTNGEYIDMMSGLDLEKELKLGGDHISSIEEGPNGVTIIKEKYAKENVTQNYYEVRTRIEETAIETRITSDLVWVENYNENPNNQIEIKRKSKTISIREDGTVTSIEETIK